MKNSYEAPEVSIISRIGGFVLGQKPWGDIDAVLGFPFRTEPLSNDIDESDE